MTAFKPGASPPPVQIPTRRKILSPKLRRRPYNRVQSVVGGCVGSCVLLRLFAVGLLAALTGCRSAVRLELPASPAIALSSDTVAIVAQDRACQPVANAVALELTRSSYLLVDPRSSLRIELFGCGDDEALTMEHLSVSSQAASEGSDVRTRIRIDTRAHAAVSVSEHGRLLAHLIAAGEDEGASGWSKSLPLMQVRQQARKRVREDLARDVVRQLNPLPTLVSRRVYPNAPAGTARELTTLAVLAERDGDLHRALDLAEAAWIRDPNPRTAGYIEELERRLSEQ
jgi:hypothetical protein